MRGVTMYECKVLMKYVQELLQRVWLVQESGVTSLSKVVLSGLECGQMYAHGMING